MSCRAFVLDLALVSTLPFVTAVHAETKICVSSDALSPLFVIGDYETKAPRLTVQFSGGEVAPNLPCTLGPSGKFECEQAPSTTIRGTLRQFVFYGVEDRPNSYEVDMHWMSKRNPPENGVEFVIRSTTLHGYDCRDFLLPYGQASK